jgi:hypothetical protein
LSSLLEQFQQKIDIRKVNLEYHPEVFEIIKLPEEEKKIRMQQLRKKCEEQNELQTIYLEYASGWQRTVDSLVQRKDSAFHYPTSAEKLFWEKFSESLEHLNHQLDSEETKIFSNIYSNIKFRAFLGELKRQIGSNLLGIQDINNFFQKLPIDELHVAHLQDLPELVSSFFEQISKVQYMKRYTSSDNSGEKVDDLIKSISIDFSDRISVLLNEQNFMLQSFTDFENSMQIVQSTFKIWSEKLNNLRSTVRNMKDRWASH